MIGLLILAVTSAAVIIGYTQARAFVSERLRYVDAAQSGVAPLVAGVGAGMVAGVVAGLLPVIGAGTAIAFGLSVGLGVASGQKAIRRALPPGA
jgi:hypothetical protein